MSTIDSMIIQVNQSIYLISIICQYNKFYQMNPKYPQPLNILNNYYQQHHQTCGQSHKQHSNMPHFSLQFSQPSIDNNDRPGIKLAQPLIYKSKTPLKQNQNDNRSSSPPRLTMKLLKQQIQRAQCNQYETKARNRCKTTIQTHKPQLSKQSMFNGLKLYTQQKQLTSYEQHTFTQKFNWKNMPYQLKIASKCVIRPSRNSLLKVDNKHMLQTKVSSNGMRSVQASKQLPQQLTATKIQLFQQSRSPSSDRVRQQSRVSSNSNRNIQMMKQPYRKFPTSAYNPPNSMAHQPLNYNQTPVYNYNSIQLQHNNNNNNNDHKIQIQQIQSISQSKVTNNSIDRDINIDKGNIVLHQSAVNWTYQSGFVQEQDDGSLINQLNF